VIDEQYLGPEDLDRRREHLLVGAVRAGKLRDADARRKAEALDPVRAREDEDARVLEDLAERLRDREAAPHVPESQAIVRVEEESTHRADVFS
jgi:hypothetical protein